MRRPNHTTTRRAHSSQIDHGLSEITLGFTAAELARLKHNKKPKNSELGGYQQMENLLIATTDPGTLTCQLSPDKHFELVEMCKKTDDGGPEARIRAACIPAFRRLQIELLPQFSSSYVRKIPHDDPRLVVRPHKNAD